MKISRQLLMTLLLLGVMTSAALADNIIGSGSGISGATSVITFSEAGLADGTVLSNQYTGVTFSGLYQNPCPTCVNAPPTGAKPDAGNFLAFDGRFLRSSSMSFDSVVNGASFNFASNGGNFTFTASLGGSVVASFSANGGSWGWYGFDNIAFDRIDISSPSEFLIDNVETRETPEPGSLMLLGSGLLGLGGAIRRKLIA